MADKTKALPRGPKYMKAWSEEIAAKLDEHDRFIQWQCGADSEHGEMSGLLRLR